MRHPVRPFAATRAVVAFVVATVVALVGLAAAGSAQAADSASTIDVHLALPAGVVAGDVPAFVQYDYRDDDGYWGFGGTAPVDGLDATIFDVEQGRDYRIALQDYSGLLAHGYYTAGGSTSPDPSRAAVVTASSHVTITAARGATISGSVQMPDGSDATALSVTAYHRAGGDDPSWDWDAGVRADESGAFSIGGLTADAAYLLELRDDAGNIVGGYYTTGGALVRGEDEATALVAPTSVTVVATAAAAISGRIALPDATDPDNVYVYAYAQVGQGDDASWEYRTSASVDEDGSFTLAGLEPGVQYIVRVDEYDGTIISGYYAGQAEALVADELSATRVMAPTDETLDLRPEVAASIAGRVDVPAGVSLDSDAVYVTAYVGDEQLDTEAVDSDGVFRLGGLHEGKKYSLEVSDDDGSIERGFYAGAGARLVEDVSDATRITASATNIVIPTTPAAAITGTVVLPSGAEPSSVRISALVREGSGDDAEWNTTSSTRVGDDLTYRLGGLRAGQEYVLQLRDDDGVVIGGYYAGAGRGFVARAGSASPVPAGSTGVALQPRTAAVISGHIDLPDGLDVGQLDLTAYEATSFDFGGNASIDEDGSFRITGLEPQGSYVLELSSWNGQVISGYYAGAGHALVRSDEDAVAVSAPRDDVQITATAAASISGSITLPADADADKVSIAAGVRSADGQGWSNIRSTTPQSDGSFTITGLTPGQKYVLRVRDDNALIIDGYYGTGGHLVDTAAAGKLVSAPATGLAIAPATAVAITGSITLPTGLDPDDIRVEARRLVVDGDDEYWTEDRDFPVYSDGSFWIGGLTPDVQYAVFATSWTGSFREGYYAGDDAVLARSLSAAELVTAPADALRLVAPAPATISGTIDLPAGVDESEIRVSAYSGDPDDDGLSFEASSSVEDGAFAITGLESGTAYRLQVWSNDGSLLRGSVLADGSVTREGDGDPLTAPTGSLHITPLVAAMISGSVVVPTGVDRSTLEVRAEYLYGDDEDGWWDSDDSVPLGPNDTFTISGLVPGEHYRLRVVSAGDVRNGYYAADGSFTPDATAAKLWLAPASNVVLRPVQAESITGSVVLPSDADPTDVQVSAYYQTGPADDRQWVEENGTDLDEQGAFRIGGLAAGVDYVIGLDDSSGHVLAGYYAGPTNPMSASADDGLVVRAGGTGSLTLTPTVAASIAGTVVVPAGVDAGDLWVQAYLPVSGQDDSYDWASDAAVSADGAFRIGGLRSGQQYLVELQDGDQVLGGYYAGASKSLVSARTAAVPVQAPTTGLQLTAAAAVSISGTIDLPEGTNPSDVWVSAQTEVVDGEDTYWRTDGSVTLDDETFSVTGLRPGTAYVLSVSDDSGSFVGGYYTSDGSLVRSRSAAARLTAPASAVHVRTVLATTIAGSVIVPAGIDPTSVGVQAEYESSPGNWNADGYASLDEDGSFRVDGLDPGESYRLVTYDDESELASGYYTADGAFTTVESDAAVWPAPSTSIALHAVRAATISGTVLVPTGYAMTDDNLHVDAYLQTRDGGWEQFTSAHAAQDGTFTLRGLASGATYRLSFLDHSELLGSGFLAADGTLVADVAQAADVTAPAVDVRIRTALPTSLEATARPQISGTTTVGSVLTATSGTWSVDGATYAYSWSRAGVLIAGATSKTYTVVPADQGKALSVTVDATLPGGVVGHASSDPTAVIDLGVAPSATLAVSGSAVVGSTLTVSAGTWSVAGATVTYQWLRSGVAIAGATGSSYVVTAADLGALLAVRATAKADGHRDANVTTASTAKVASAGPPTATVAPKITGAAVVDGRLTASAGTWSVAGVTLTYQWLRSGVAIAGATGSSYTVTAADAGKPLAVKVVATVPGHVAGSATSASTAVVTLAAAATATKTPTVTGTVAVGASLHTSGGSWSLSGVRRSYQWLRSGVAIKGATSSSYKVTTKDVGKKLSVRVQAALAGHSAGTATSKSTKSVPKATPTVKSKLAKTSISRTTRGKVSVTVTASGVKAPTGTVSVKVGKATVKATLTSRSKGKVTITLPKVTTKGTVSVSVSFKPNGSTAKVVSSAKAKTVKLKVK